MITSCMNIVQLFVFIFIFYQTTESNFHLFIFKLYAKYRVLNFSSIFILDDYKGKHNRFITNTSFLPVAHAPTSLPCNPARSTDAPTTLDCPSAVSLRAHQPDRPPVHPSVRQRSAVSPPARQPVRLPVRH